MKNLILLAITFLFYQTLQAQNVAPDKVPPPVSKAFNAKFPKAGKVKWEMEGANQYEANFVKNKMNKSAVFDPNGTWKETETQIKITELSPTIRSSIPKQFKGYKITKAYKVEKSEGAQKFEVVIKKGASVYEVTYSVSGEMLGKHVGED